jgi:hypothetical protein
VAALQEAEVTSMCLMSEHRTKKSARMRSTLVFFLAASQATSSKKIFATSVGSIAIAGCGSIDYCGAKKPVNAQAKFQHPASVSPSAAGSNA